MKKIFLLFIIVAVSCSITKKVTKTEVKLKILKVDSTSYLYVFTCKNPGDSDVLIIAEKGKLINCKPFKKFILLDSVKQTMQIKDGLKIDNIGFDGLTIGMIKVKKAGELAKIISDCSAITD